jgi:glycosyltransferase involved in cell wall biosynthesis
MKNLISVIIPTYNRNKKLKRALESVINQSYFKWEVIVVDNYSNDGTQEMIKKFNNPKIQFYKFFNKGVIAASRNFAIRKSKGTILAFLDSDDWWTEDKLYYSNKYFNKGYKFLYHDMRIKKKNQFFTRKIGYCRNLAVNQFEDLKENGPAFATSSVIIEKKLFSKVKLFNENKKYVSWEDFDAWLRVSKVYNNFHKIDKSLGFINIDDENYLNSRRVISNLTEFKKLYLNDKDLPNWGIYNIIRANYTLGNYKIVKKEIKKIRFRRLKLRNLIFIFYIYINFLLGN